MRLRDKTEMKMKSEQLYDHVPRFIVTDTGFSSVMSDVDSIAPTGCWVTVVYTRPGIDVASDVL